MEMDCRTLLTNKLSFYCNTVTVAFVNHVIINLIIIINNNIKGVVNTLITTPTKINFNRILKFSVSILPRFLLPVRIVCSTYFTVTVEGELRFTRC